MAGIEGVLNDPRGNVANDFGWGRRNTTNNEVKALTMSQGLGMLQECSFKQTTVVSDSSIIIQLSELFPPF